MRRTGKTFRATLTALISASDGLSVLYVTHNRATKEYTVRYMNGILSMMVEYHEIIDHERTKRSSIYFKPEFGGNILVKTREEMENNSHRGRYVDIVINDSGKPLDERGYFKKVLDYDIGE